MNLLTRFAWTNWTVTKCAGKEAALRSSMQLDLFRWVVTFSNVLTVTFRATTKETSTKRSVGPIRQRQVRCARSPALALTTATFRRSPRGKTGRICLWSQRSWIRRRPALTQLCKLNLAMTWCTTRISRNHKKFVKESTTTSKRWTFQFQCTTCSKKTEWFN